MVEDGLTPRVTGPPQLLAKSSDRDIGVSGQQVGDQGFESIEFAGAPYLGRGVSLLEAFSTGRLELLQNAPYGFPADPKCPSDPPLRRAAVEQGDDLASEGMGHYGAISWANSEAVLATRLASWASQSNTGRKTT